MTTTPLPPLYEVDKGSPEWLEFDAAFLAQLRGTRAPVAEVAAFMGWLAGKAARADLEAEVQRLREALKRIESMCAAPPDFSDATIQDVARAALKDTKWN